MKHLIISLLTISILFSGCTPNNLSQSKKIRVVTTIGMIADAVKNVANPELVIVESLMGPGVDPHLYKASFSDTKKLENADVIFFGGLHLEGKMVEIFEDLARRQPTIAVSKNIPREKLLISRQANQQVAKTVFDPHIWFDVSIWMEAVKIIAEELSTYDPAHKNIYQQNAAAYLQKLADLHSWTAQEIAKIPKTQRLLITSHDAFSYFGRAYNIEVEAIQGISTASDFGLKDLERIINLVIERNIKAIFVESSVPKKSIAAVQEGVRGRTKEVVIGGQLFSDSMGDPATPEGTYIGMVQYNVSTIVNNLK